MKKNKKSYTKIFSIPDVAERTLAMLLKVPPVPYSLIAEKLGCHRSSVIYFHKKKIKEGLTLNNFNGVKVEILGGTKKVAVDVINTGKNYKDYLKGYVKKRDKIQLTRMKSAKKTIDKIKKKRKSDGLDIDLDMWDF